MATETGLAIRQPQALPFFQVENFRALEPSDLTPDGIGGLNDLRRMCRAILPGYKPAQGIKNELDILIAFVIATLENPAFVESADPSAIQTELMKLWDSINTLLGVLKALYESREQLVGVTQEALKGIPKMIELQALFTMLEPSFEKAGLNLTLEEGKLFVIVGGRKLSLKLHKTANEGTGAVFMVFPTDDSLEQVTLPASLGTRAWFVVFRDHENIIRLGPHLTDKDLE